MPPSWPLLLPPTFGSSDPPDVLPLRLTLAFWFRLHCLAFATSGPATRQAAIPDSVEALFTIRAATNTTKTTAAAAAATARLSGSASSALKPMTAYVFHQSRFGSILGQESGTQDIKSF
jgi:hypothetical protein